MKKMRKIIPALAMLLMSAVLMSTASFAWFSMNTSVTATGMKVRAQAAGGSLIIGDNISELMTNAESTITVNDTNIPALKAVTWTPASGDVAGAWQYANGKDVDTATGLLKTGTDIKLNNVGEATGYYYDKIFYIASAGGTLEDQTLTATATISFAGTGDKPQDMKALDATSVAVTLLESSTGVYKFTEATAKADGSVAPKLNVAYVNQNTDNSENLATGLTIPTVSADALEGEDTVGALAVLVRIYFDGNLKTGDGSRAYVRDANYLNDNMSVEVVFSVGGEQAAEPAEPEGT